MSAPGVFDPPAGRWLTVAELARAEGTTPRSVYGAIDVGLRHSRIGRRIRVRRCDWHQLHEANLIGGAS